MPYKSCEENESRLKDSRKWKTAALIFETSFSAVAGVDGRISASDSSLLRKTSAPSFWRHGMLLVKSETSPFHCLFFNIYIFTKYLKTNLISTCLLLFFNSPNGS